MGILSKRIGGAGMDLGLFDEVSSLMPGTISFLKMDAQSIQGEIIDKIEKLIFLSY
jgi:hypothetical protein